MELKLFLQFFAMISIIQLSFLPKSCSESIQANNHSDTKELGLRYSADFVESRLSPLTAFDVVSGTIGIADAVLSAFGVGWSFAAPPKYTTDDIMNELKSGFGNLGKKIDTQFTILDSKINNLASGISTLRNDVISGFNAIDSQFAAVHSELGTIYQTLLKIELEKYSDVEVAVKGALSDVRYNSSLDLIRRATNLCDQLSFYMGGLLGTNGFATDILNLTVSQNECSGRTLDEKLSNNYRSMGCLDNRVNLTQCSFVPVIQKMDSYYGLMSLGFIGLGFYSKLIGPALNGQARLVDYLSQKDLLNKRIRAAQEACSQAQEPFVFSQNTISKLIFNYNLSQANIKTPADVSNALYTYLDNFYLRNISLNWLIYVIEPSPGDGIRAFNSYIGSSGSAGQTKIGKWNIYWAAQNGLPKESLTILEDGWNSIGNAYWLCESWMHNETPFLIYLGILETVNNDHPIPLTSGRSPTTVFVFTSSTPIISGSIGMPVRGRNSPTISPSAPGSTNLTNVYYSGRFEVYYRPEFDLFPEPVSPFDPVYYIYLVIQ